MTKLESAYARCGMDYAGTIDRCAGDEQMLKDLLSMFLADDNFKKLMSALNENNAEMGFRAAHSLKGSSGMLGMTGLHGVLKDMTECLRAGDTVSAASYREAAKREYAAAAEMIGSL